MKPLFKLLRSFIIFLLVYLFIIIFLLNFRAVPLKRLWKSSFFEKELKIQHIPTYITLFLLQPMINPNC